MIRKLAKPNGKCPDALLIHKECILLADDSRSFKKDGTKSKSIGVIIDAIIKWNKTRDQYIHSFYNKDYDEAMSRLPELVNEGIILSDELKNYTKRLKTQAKNWGLL